MPDGTINALQVVIDDGDREAIAAAAAKRGVRVDAFALAAILAAVDIANGDAFTVKLTRGEAVEVTK